MLLETLDSIPWDQLNHAYGPAGDVPETLRALANSDPEERCQALNELYGNIFHQGTRYEATPYAVPFLIELAANPAVPDRAGILVLLAHVALGYPDDIFLPRGVDAVELRTALKSAHQSMSSEDRKECQTYHFGPLIDLACYDAVQSELPSLLSLIRDPNEDIRCASAYLFAFFPDLSPSSVPELISVAENARSDRERAHALIAIGLLGVDAVDEDRIRSLGEYCADSHPLLVRTAAAIALNNRAGHDTQEVLIQALLGARTLTFRSDELAFNEGNLAGLVALMLSDAPAHTHDRLVPALCGVLETVNPYQSLDITRALLELVSGDRAHRAMHFKGKSPSDLTPLQRMALESIRDHGGWKYGVGDFVNYAELVEYFGLPRSRDGLQAYLEI